MKKLIFFSIAALFAYITKAQSPELLKISANKRFITTQSNKPFFWLGDTGWLLFVKASREEAEQYLEDRKQKGFNVIQVMVLHDLKHAVNVYGDSALQKGNVAKPVVTKGNNFNNKEAYDFWDHVEYIVDLAASKGLYMAMVPVWGTNVKNGWVTPQQATVYATFLANRFKNKTNIIWLNGGDIKGTDKIAVWNTIGATLKTKDPAHLLTFHPRGRFSSSEWFHNKTWLDFNMIQSGHRNYAQDTSKGEHHYGEDNWKYIDVDYSKKPVKPIIDGEPSYEAIPYGLHDTTLPYWNAAEIRRYGYWSVFAGAFGFTYGHNSVMQFYKPSDNNRAYGAKKFWTESLSDEAATQMQYLKALMLSKPYLERTPAQELVPANGERYDRVLATKGKTYAFFYTWNGRTFKVDLAKLNIGAVKAGWYNPRNGETTAIGEYDGKKTEEFYPAGGQSNGNDWVLVIEKK
jgi:hypothetical protein